MKSIFFLLMIAGSLCGCGSDSPPAVTAGRSLTDSTGTAFSLEPLPSRIISFAPYITQNIYLLGAGDKLVGVTKFCKLPAGEKKQVIGDLLTQDIERIIQLKPELVLATKEGNKPEVVNQLKGLGIRVFVLSEANSWKDIRSGFMQMAELLGKTADAQKILEQLEVRLSAVREKNALAGSPSKVFFQLSEQFHTAAKDTFADEVITQAGAVNIAHNAVGRWPMLSAEEVIAQDPDLIIIPLMGNITEQAKAGWEKFPLLKAVKSNKIVIADADLCCLPTPENFVGLTELISEILHK
ncbi:MAG: ABC transporter substrate-binding protein [Planctomycetes bacterium]|nr:ABC transporter substrate-binding protein [Planctomycetota bacterium]